MYYLIRLSQPNLFLKRNIDSEVIYSLVPTCEQATEFTRMEIASLTLLTSDQYFYISVQDHKANLKQAMF